MFFNLRKRAYVKAMREAAKTLTPTDEKCEKIFDSVMLAAGVTAVGVSFAAASSKVASMAKLALVKTIGVTAAVTVGVTAAGSTLLAPPSIREISVLDEAPHSQSQIVIKTGPVLSVQQVTVIDENGTPLSALPANGGRYSVYVDHNGTYEVQVTGSNGMDSTIVDVDGIDSDIPVMVEYYNDGERLSIYFSDEKSGVDWESVYGVTADGQEIRPVEYDLEQGCVVFETPQEDMQIYLRDLAGNWATSSVNLV